VTKKQPQQTKAAAPAPVAAAAPPVTEKPISGRGGGGRGRGARGSGGRGGRPTEKNGKPIKHDGFDRHSGTGR
jgi:hypothetical protein